MQSEVTVTLKSEDSTFRKQFNCYDPISISENCPNLRSMIAEAKKEFKLIPDEISIRINIEWMEG